MKVTNLERFSREDRTRITAKVSWEDCGRSEQDLFFEVDSKFADGLSSNADAFLAACILPAMREGEKRLYIDGEVCPELRDGVVDVMSWMRHWHYSANRPLVEIEAKMRNDFTAPPKPERSGLFLSGGIDSLATLRANLNEYPEGHPGFIKDAVLVFGLEIHQMDKYEHVVHHISEIARDADKELISIYTNVRDLGPPDTGEFWSDFWVNEFEGAAFSAIAHALSGRLTKMFFSASYDVPTIFRWGKSFFTGSHPLIDPNFGSSDLAIILSGISLTRFEKTKLISNWDVALDHIRVCNMSRQYTSEFLNCGECEKCLRTMLAMHALGALERSKAFAVKDIHASKIKSNVSLSKINFNYWEELLEPLSKAGDHDIVKVIKGKLFKKKLIFRTIEPVRDLDKKLTGGTLVKLKRLILKKGISY